MRVALKINLLLKYKLLHLHSLLKKGGYDSVAQLVEHYTFNVVVLGSNPSGITGTNIRPLIVNTFKGFLFDV